MNITKNIITRDEAITISPEYVKFVEGDWSAFDAIIEKFRNIKRGQRAISYTNKQFVIGRISSVNHNDFRAEDGPVVRFTNDEYSWRVDGDEYAFPVEVK